MRLPTRLPILDRCCRDAFPSFSTDALTAHIEAMLRHRGYHGYIVDSQFRQDFVASPTRLYLLMYAENATRDDTTPSRLPR